MLYPSDIGVLSGAWYEETLIRTTDSYTKFMLSQKMFFCHGVFTIPEKEWTHKSGMCAAVPS